ncbi:hypothetical protein E2C01_102685 [Portunus trituberculatus]|uniref:Uncharacterized protein n=1 Tax=Portunus trituberculatus TaxID=210409 RepID=A0A5B7KIY0_PORTR|nr:hypothetical protein [Portunus trituberculatus]
MKAIKQLSIKSTFSILVSLCNICPTSTHLIPTSCPLHSTPPSPRLLPTPLSIPFFLTSCPLRPHLHSYSLSVHLILYSISCPPRPPLHSTPLLSTSCPPNPTLHLLRISCRPHIPLHLLPTLPSTPPPLHSSLLLSISPSTQVKVKSQISFTFHTTN